MSLVKKEESKFSIFDKLDEKQITNADEAVKKKMVYKYQNNNELTFVGLKFIVLEMANKGMPLEIESSESKLEKDDPDDKTMWFWRAKVKVRNQFNNYPSEGLAECAYLDGGKYDTFARTTAHSKAERNAWRKQVPEQRIIELLKAVDPEQVHEVDKVPQKEICDCENPIIGKMSGKCVTCGGKQK